MRRVSRHGFAVFVALVAAIAVPAALGGCETVKGVGKDIQNAGEAGERAIDDDK
jgi:predicted small secreted protein